jgi:pheromone shutdown protein TraB
VSSVLAYVVNIYRSSRCACVFGLVGYVLSCCVLSCVSQGTLDAHMCLGWWVMFSPVVCCAACLKVLSMRMCVWVGGLCSLLLCVELRVSRSSRCAYVFGLVGYVLSCCVC